MEAKIKIDKDTLENFNSTNYNSFVNSFDMSKEYYT